MKMPLYEEVIARYWWSLPPGSLLPLTNGDVYQLLFAGRPGGSAGPDVRAAVLCSYSPHCPLPDQSMRGMLHARKYIGDVEFHVRVSDWFGHRHHSDARYNNVVLHVVLFCNDYMPTLRQDGMMVPVCSLSDLPARNAVTAFGEILQDSRLWPCQKVLSQMTPVARDKLLEDIGILRFEQKAHTFVEQLHEGGSLSSSSSFTLYDACLLPALAEGLGYGRNRDFFRAVGLRLSGQETTLPEPLGHTPGPTLLDGERLQSLSLLIEHAQDSGMWQTLQALLCLDATAYLKLRALRALFADIGLSIARADILIVNVVLPFAAAVALLEHDALLNERAVMLYKMHPGLSSNWITRMMSVQLQMPSEPRGSCRQQGLHYIYRETCREKCCDLCIMGREPPIL